MGMSASQARFLSLTARKSNVEFEGQQINQQRTTLSNESASYYSELCNMEVPTPPSVDDYTKISYTFNDGAMSNTIISILSKGNDMYSISYLEQWQDDYSIVSAASSLVSRAISGKYKIGNTDLRKIGEPFLTYISSGRYAQVDSSGNVQNLLYNYEGEFYNYSDIDGDGVPMGTPVDVAGQTLVSYRESGGNIELGDVFTVPSSGNITTYNDPYLSTLTDDQKHDLAETEQYYVQMLKEKTGKDEWYVRYIQNTTSGVYVPYFYAEEDLENGSFYNANGLGNIDCFSIGSTTKTKEVLNHEGKIEKDASGRFVAITLFDEQGNPTTYTLTTTTSTDEEAYNDAMNQYNFEQHEYDHKVQEINSKLEIIQQQDKQLELKLKQLDTEENAISTEMDAVKKVISKNVESSFKTFNA